MEDQAPSVAAPPSLRWIGSASVAVGLGLALLNFWLVEGAVSELSRHGISGGALTALRVDELVMVGVGVLLAAGGVGLRGGNRWGRIMSLVAAGSTFLGVFVATATPRIAEALVERDYRGPAFSVPTGAPALTPLWGVALLVLLNLRDVRAWASGLTAEEVAAQAVPERTNGLAVASFVLSMIPFALVTQLVGLILGVIALGQIKQSQGKLGGRGFAVAGIAIASSILALIGAIILFVVLLPKHR